ncbi:hypothetical protein [Dictyobacter kobayashii]|uniref:Uncharacterized protein n=1 Tax=Dictyobacter kobayashii TaxID=2014872 RepID=A0A402AV57_9CHLR|nr:hypothetical protein [Dictyobacter kobayashii]GCE22893.1 hypothetical protein KDK_66930 [Dictyobacter kobayashii]
MDSVEFVDYIEPYIEASVDYIVQYMQQEGLYTGHRNDAFWNMLFEEIRHFLIRTYDTYEVEELPEAEATMCWAFGYHDDDIAGWSWIRGEEKHARYEEGPIIRALINSRISVPLFYERYPKNHWIEIWYGPGTIKLIRNEGERKLLTMPGFMEARIELMQRRLNEYYSKDHQEEREIEAEDAEGIVVKMRQKLHAELPGGQKVYYYTCQIEQPRGLIQFSSEKFPSQSLDELILMLCYDVAGFERFFTRNRFEELIGPHGSKNAIAGWQVVSQAQQVALERIKSQDGERQA